MKRDLAFSGVVGLVSGIFFFFVANWIKSYVPSLVSSLLPTTVVFVILLLTALVEMPLMLFALRKISQSETMPRSVVTGTFSLYVLFASVYASLHVLITGDNYFYFGTILAALGLARFVSGVLIK